MDKLNPKTEDFKPLILTMAKQINTLTEATRILLRSDINHLEAIVKYPPVNTEYEKLTSLQFVADEEKRLRDVLFDLLEEMDKKIRDLLGENNG